jgi:hypothetical protein
MTYSRRSIAVHRLLLDERNARLGDEQPNQQATVRALAQLLGKELMEQAADIVENGLDPTNLITVTPDESRINHYRVIEGNRRLLALKALDDPSIVESVLSPARRKRLAELSELHNKEAFSSIPCVVFDSELSARHWIELRHTGANNGVGLVEWDANEKDRYRSRHGGSSDRSPAGQIMDFVDSLEEPPDDSKPIISTIKRLIATPSVRERLGIEIKDGKVHSLYPAEEVIKGLRTIVDDLRSGAIKVSNVYHLDDRTNYMDGFDPSLLPNPDRKFDKSVELTKLSVGVTPAVANGSVGGPPPAPASASPTPPPSAPAAAPSASSGPASPTSAAPAGAATKQPPSTARVYPPRVRATLIPSSCALHITDPRIKSIYHELRRLNVEQFPNVSAVGLRVFLELSVDHHLGTRNIMAESVRNTTRLAKRLKDLAHDMYQANEIPLAVERVVIKVADGGGSLNATTFALNQYVHNQFAFPKATEILTAWDELQPFLQALWKK